MNNMVKRGEIYMADLSGVQGSKQGGIRPVLVIQNDTGNMHSPTTIVAAITTKNKTNIPTHIELDKCLCSLPQDSIVLMEQIRTIDKSRLIRQIGSVPLDYMDKINNAILISFGFMFKSKQSKRFA